MEPPVVAGDTRELVLWVARAMEPWGYAEALRRAEQARGVLWAWKDRGLIDMGVLRRTQSEIGGMEAGILQNLVSDDHEHPL